MLTMDMPARGGHRPSSLVPVLESNHRDKRWHKTLRRTRTGENLLALRFSLGLDLWTGLPLQGQDAADHAKLMECLKEHGKTPGLDSPDVGIDHVRPDRVKVVLN